MDVVKTADWIIDIGPEGGEEGGHIVAMGTPEQIAQLDTPTGQAIQEALYHEKEEKTASPFKEKKKPKKDEKQKGASKRFTLHRCRAK